MSTWVVLLRGINVVGNRVLPMKELVTLLECNGFAAVRSYIQSGNVVLRSRHRDPHALAKRVGALVLAARGFEPEVIVLSVGELRRAVAANPFPEATRDPKALHLYFLTAAPPAADLESLKRLRTGRERFALRTKVFYLHTPDGFATSKLASRAEKHIGVAATARNWRTVQKLLEMARQSG